MSVTSHHQQLVITRWGKAIEPSPEILAYLDPLQGRDGIYESIRTYQHIPFRLQQHLARLERSAQQSGLALPASVEDIESWILELASSAPYDPQFIKLVVTAEEVLIFCRPLEIDPIVYEGVKTISVPLVRSTPDIKQLDIVRQQQARLQAEQSGAYEALIVDDEGRIPEGAYSNLFWVQKDRLFTCTKGALQGITQAAVSELASPDFPVQEGLLSLDSLDQIDELFLTQTSRGIVPILQVDDKMIKDGKIGPVTQLLMQRFDSLTQLECSSSASKSR